MADRRRGRRDHGVKIRVLYIEDDPASTALVRISLDRDDSSEFELESVETLAEAREYIAKRTPDVVLLDLGLPDSQDLESVSTVRALAPEMPIVVLTAHSYSEMRIAALHHGADEFLEKENSTESCSAAS